MLEHEKEKKDLPVQKAAEQDNPPYLASLLVYHPGLTREEALEMIKEAGRLKVTCMPPTSRHARTNRPPPGCH